MIKKIAIAAAALSGILLSIAPSSALPVAKVAGATTTSVQSVDWHHHWHRSYHHHHWHR